jgi:hypothetical protein
MLASDVMEPCQDPRLNQAIPAFCFNELSEAERDAFALHLLDCPACLAQVERLQACADAARFDPRLKPMRPTPAVLSVLALSGRLEQAFGGHQLFVSVACVLYGLLFAASVWTELGYSYGRYAALAWALTPVAGCGSAAVLAAAFVADLRRVVRGRADGLVWSISVALSGVVLLTSTCMALLPDTPTVQATFQVRSAAGGFQKNVFNYFLPSLLFLLPTFHTVVALQRELLAGRHAATFALLARKPEGVTPRGVWLVPLWGLLAILLFGVAIGYHGVNNMLDHLVPGPYASLFSIALYVRAAVWYIVALMAMAWYQRCLDELKREALAGIRLFGAA